MAIFEALVAVVFLLFFLLMLIFELRSRNILYAEKMMKMFNILVTIIILLIVSSLIFYNKLC